MEIIFVVTAAAAVYFGIRYTLLKRGLREVSRELDDITRNLKENRILKLLSPQRELEILLSSMNHTLDQIRKDRISYEKREQEFQRQLEDISHDLRTPLTAIQGYIKLINQEKLEDEDQEYLNVIRRRSAHLQYLIDQFYEFSTLLSGTYKMEYSRIDLARMCREQLLGSYQQLEAAGIEVQVRIPEKPVWILADENALSRIIGNLLQNAVRYAKHTLRIEIKEMDGAEAGGTKVCSGNTGSQKTGGTEESDGVTLICANDAEYMTEDAVQQIFDRFYTGDRARNQGGTGLGLAISRQLAEQMGGNMTVERRKMEDGVMQDGIWLIFKTTFKL